MKITDVQQIILARSSGADRWAEDETSLPESRTREVNTVSSGWAAWALEGPTSDSTAGTRWLGPGSNPRKPSTVQAS